MATTESICMACTDPSCSFAPTRLARRALGDLDVKIDIKFCGVCHTDLHCAAGHLAKLMGPTTYPCVPGHEIVGVCTAVGSAVRKIAVGDHVGIGCFVDSCRSCAACASGNEQLCTASGGPVWTYGTPDRFGRAATPSSSVTLGGYSTAYVVDEHFAIQIPKAYPLEMAGPVMCSGITMYEPLRTHGAKKGTRVGVVGLGGLGVMGIKLAKALGCHVTAISRTAAKRDFALVKCGADAYVASAEIKELAAARKTLDLVLNTIPADHDSAPYTRLLRRGGKHVFLGLNNVAIGAMLASKLTCGTSAVKISSVGGVAATQEVIDLCAAQGIYPEVVVRPVDDLNRIFEDLDKSNDAGVRYVLDIENTLNAATFDRPAAAPTDLKPAKDAATSPVLFLKRALAHLLFSWA